MVYSPKLTFFANDNNLTSVGLTRGETICFGSLEFTTDHFGCLSLSPEWKDSSVVFVGMVHTRPPSLHIIPRNSPIRATLPRAKEGAPDSPTPKGAMW
jgi:hypothetical protein